MPELPEVETMRRGVLPVRGCVIAAARRTRCQKRPISISPAMVTLQRRLKGRRIQDIQRLGKRLILVLEDQSRLVFEPRMSGLISLGQPPNRQHLRFELRLKDPHGEQTLWFWDRRGLGSITLYGEHEFEERFHRGAVGPDALTVTARQLQIAAGKSKRPIKVALLDQRLVAGIGNIYASEILHRSGNHPGQPCWTLDFAQWQRIRRAIRTVLLQAIRHEGSTLSDGTYRTKLNRPGRYQNQHRVYGLQSQICSTCGQAPIERIVQAQRTTFFCPNCQPPVSGSGSRREGKPRAG